MEDSKIIENMAKKENINNRNIKWGSNNFKDGEFDYFEWSAPVIQDRDNLKKKLDSFKLIGRRIKSMRFVGHCYNLTEDGIEERILDSMEEKGIDTKQFDNGLFYELRELDDLDQELPITCSCAMIDEPFIIYFEDDFGDLEIDYSEGSTVRLGSNCIPEGIEPGVNRRSFDANVLFSEIIGGTIKNIYIETSFNLDSFADFTGSYGLDLEELEEYIRKITFVIENGQYHETYELSFNSIADYGEIELTKFGKQMARSLSQFRKGIL